MELGLGFNSIGSRASTELLSGFVQSFRMLVVGLDGSVQCCRCLACRLKRFEPEFAVYDKGCESLASEYGIELWNIVMMLHKTCCLEGYTQIRAENPKPQIWAYRDI